MTYHFRVGDDVETNDGAGRIINRQDGNFHVQLQQGIYVYTAEMMKPLETGQAPMAPWEKELLGTPFEQNVRRHTDRIATLLIEKNKQYSNSALDPIRVFSKADRTEQLRVRADDKLSRIRNGDTSEDAVLDLCGYLILLRIAAESE